ncbi:polysaccharide biosynthesis C-terminal domain-containing protein [Saliphagus sp. GCM10025334]
MSRSLSTAVGAVLSSRILLVATGALITPILTRLLGPSAYGQYATILSIYILVKILMVSGVRSGAKKFFSDQRGLSNWRNYVWATYLRMSIAIGSLFAFGLGILVFLDVISTFFGISYVLPFYLLIVLLLITQFQTLSVSTLMGLHLEKYAEPIQVVEKISFGIIAVSLIVLGYGVPGVIFGHIMSIFFTLLICMLIIRNYLKLTSFIEPVPRSFPKRELWHFNNYSVIFSFLLYSFYHVDVILLQSFTNEELVGYYKVALVVVEILWLFPQSVQAVLIQSVSELWRSESASKINKLSTEITRYVFLLTVLLAAGLASLAELFIPLYFGDDYSAAVIPLLILLPGTICFAVVRPSLAITHAKGDLRPLIVATGIAAGINILLNLLLIPSFGLIGAAIATTIGYSSLLITQVFSARYVGYDPISGTQPIRILSTGVLTVLVLHVSINRIGNTGIVFFLIPLLGTIVFTIISIFFGVMSIRELRSIWVKIT